MIMFDLHLVGEIDLPKELNDVKKKICLFNPFMDYKKASPELISKDGY
ncbi:MAG: hypothetical protein ACLTTH_16350 [Holdemanella porci]